MQKGKIQINKLSQLSQLYRKYKNQSKYKNDSKISLPNQKSDTRNVSCLRIIKLICQKNRRFSVDNDYYATSKVNSRQSLLLQSNSDPKINAKMHAIEESIGNEIIKIYFR